MYNDNLNYIVKGLGDIKHNFYICRIHMMFLSSVSNLISLMCLKKFVFNGLAALN